MRRPFLHFFRQQMRGKCACKHVPLQIDISESAFFALLIYQLLFEQKNEDSLCCSFTMYPTRQNFARKCLQIYCKIAVPPAQRAVFLCKTAKYTSCTVFQRKFIHFSKGVNSRSKTRAIFVRFCPANLQFASFFLRGLLLSRAFAIIIVYNGVCAEPPFTDDVFTF